MQAFERLVRRMADWNGMWWGLGWLRWAKSRRISLGRFALLAFLLAAPGAITGLGLRFFALGELDSSLVVILSGGLVLLQGYLNAPLVCSWNRRAATTVGQG